MGSLGRAVAHSGPVYLLIFLSLQGCLKSSSKAPPSALTSRFLPLEIFSIMEGQQFLENRGKLRKINRTGLSWCGHKGGRSVPSGTESGRGQNLETPLGRLLHMSSLCASLLCPVTHLELGVFIAE